MILLIRPFHSPSKEPTSSEPSPLSTPKSAGGPAISSQPKTTWPPPLHVTLPPSSLGRARPSRSTGGARRKLWTGVPAAAQISSLTTVMQENGTLLFHAINVNDSVTNSKRRRSTVLYGSRYHNYFPTSSSMAAVRHDR
ncbi:hypothetical protein WN944_018166 [Citrus x changshan-huyou]|uniref:Uncharacterized protein n=1 Tax=Citrus x changshan-huyou TaxID=2935761 RepID=A0AAP0LVR9_9ROSI